MHSVRISGLQPGTSLPLPHQARGVVLNEGNKRVILDEGYGNDILKHKTLHRNDPRPRTGAGRFLGRQRHPLGATRSSAG